MVDFLCANEILTMLLTHLTVHLGNANSLLLSSFGGFVSKSSVFWHTCAFPSVKLDF